MLGEIVDLGRTQTISLERYNELISTEARYHLVLNWLRQGLTPSSEELLQLLDEGGGGE